MYRFNCSACHFGWATIIKINQVIRNVCVWFLVVVVVIALHVRFFWFDSNCSKPLFHTSTFIHLHSHASVSARTKHKQAHTRTPTQFNGIHHPWLTLLLVLCYYPSASCCTTPQFTVRNRKKKVIILWFLFQINFIAHKIECMEKSNLKTFHPEEHARIRLENDFRVFSLETRSTWTWSHIISRRQRRRTIILCVSNKTV